MPDQPSPPADRPSDTEAAHAPQEGGAVRDPRLPQDASVDQNHGSLDGHASGRDRREDYGKGTDVQDADGSA